MTEGNKVVDHQNHDISTAYSLAENQVVSHILNGSLTDGGIPSWYNVTITQTKTYRFNFNPNYAYNGLNFVLYNGSNSQEGTYFPTSNISQSLLTTLTPGTYSIKINNQFYGWPVAFTLWYTSSFEIQAPSPTKIGDVIYGVISNQSGDVYNLTVSHDAVIYFIHDHPPVNVTLLTQPNSTTVSSYSKASLPDDNNKADVIYTPAGDYSFTVNTTVSTYQEYVLYVSAVQPDFLDTHGNSRDNPQRLEPNNKWDQSLHIPSDRDWYTFRISSPGKVTIGFTGIIQVNVTKNGEQIPYSDNGILSFQATPGDFLIEIYSSQIVVFHYTVIMQFEGSTSTTIEATPLTTTTVTSTQQTITESSKNLTLGFPFLESLFLIMIPMMMAIDMRRKQKSQ